MEAADLASLLVDLWRRRFSGVLELRHGRVTKRIAWAGGVPTFAESSRPSERLGEFLVQKGLLDPAQRARLDEQVRGRGRSQLSGAVKLGLLAPRELLGAVHEHLKGCLVDAFGWPTLEFALEPASLDTAPGSGVDPLAVVQEGIGSRWSPEQLVEKLGEKALLFARALPRARDLAERVGGGGDLDRLLGSLDGRRTLGECLHAAGTSRAFATAWLLDAAGALVYADAPPREEEEPDAPELEIVVAAAPGESSAEVVRARRGTGEAEADRQAAALRAEVERLHRAIDERDCYELLGVAPDASVPAIRQAYRSAAKRLHPDALVRLGLDDLKEKANQLFSRISIAHGTLSDPARRREYDSARSVGGQDEADRVARAETFYRKALVFLRAGRFAEALPLLESCVSLWPDEAAYQADLGWALFKIAEPRLPQARTALERAVGLDPSGALALFRLSLVLGAIGEAEQAAALRARAQRLDPSLR